MKCYMLQDFCVAVCRATIKVNTIIGVIMGIVSMYISTPLDTSMSLKVSSLSTPIYIVACQRGGVSVIDPPALADKLTVFSLIEPPGG